MKKNNKKQNKGFSLVELVIVVAIMAILVGILAPQYIKYVERSRKAADASNAENFATAIKVANADGKYTITKGSFTVTIGANGTTVNSNQLDKAFEEYIGTNWKATKLKSKKWGAAVTVKCDVAESGSVTVTYTPDSLANFFDESN